MVFALFLWSVAADWTPMRWNAPEASSLKVLKGTPINCLLLEKASLNQPVVPAATEAGIDTLAVITSAATEERVRKAYELKVKGIVLEGKFASVEPLRKLAVELGLFVVDLPARAQMKFDSSERIVGTYQGVWPGIQVEHDGATKAAPSGGPWINTNSGFLRFVRASTDAPIWIGVRPPEKTVITPERYLQAISDAGIVGAHWIVALDDDFNHKLLSGDESTAKAWQRMTQLLAYYDSHKDWRAMKPAGQLAIVQDIDSGALLSGGVLDMIAVKHTPVRTVPKGKLTLPGMQGTKLAVNVDPSSLTDEQKAALRAWTRAGGTLLSGPASWKFPPPQTDQITLSDDDVKMLDDIWKEMNAMTGRRNLGARLFNVSSMLSNLVQDADQKQTVLQLVNYSGFPVENVTIHVLGKFKSARLLAPGAAPKKLDLYEAEDDGMGVDIDTVNVAATLLLE